MAALINQLIPASVIVAGGWRIPFLIIDGVFGVFTMYLYRWLRETLIFIEVQAGKALAHEL